MPFLRDQHGAEAEADYRASRLYQLIQFTLRQKFIQGAHGADFCRMYFLYVNGGVYMDTDAIIYPQRGLEHALEDLLDDYDFVALDAFRRNNRLSDELFREEGENHSPLPRETVRVTKNIGGEGEGEDPVENEIVGRHEPEYTGVRGILRSVYEKSLGFVKNKTSSSPTTPEHQERGVMHSTSRVDPDSLFSITEDPCLQPVSLLYFKPFFPPVFWRFLLKQFFKWLEEHKAEVPQFCLPENQSFSEFEKRARTHEQIFSTPQNNDDQHLIRLYGHHGLLTKIKMTLALDDEDNSAAELERRLFQWANSTTSWSSTNEETTSASINLTTTSRPPSRFLRIRVFNSTREREQQLGDNTGENPLIYRHANFFQDAPEWRRHFPASTNATLIDLGFIATTPKHPIILEVLHDLYRVRRSVLVEPDKNYWVFCSKMLRAVQRFERTNYFREIEERKKLELAVASFRDTEKQRAVASEERNGSGLSENEAEGTTRGLQRENRNFTASSDKSLFELQDQGESFHPEGSSTTPSPEGSTTNNDSFRFRDIATLADLEHSDVDQTAPARNTYLLRNLPGAAGFETGTVVPAVVLNIRSRGSIPGAFEKKRVVQTVERGGADDELFAMTVLSGAPDLNLDQLQQEDSHGRRVDASVLKRERLERGGSDEIAGGRDGGRAGEVGESAQKPHDLLSWTTHYEAMLRRGLGERELGYRTKFWREKAAAVLEEGNHPRLPLHSPSEEEDGDDTEEAEEAAVLEPARGGTGRASSAAFSARE